MSRNQELLLANNKEYAKSEGKCHLSEEALKHLFILTCIDPRIDTNKFLRLAEGDAYIFRNGGARVTDDSIRSMTAAIRFADVNEVFIIKHTDCLFHKTTTLEIQEFLHENLGPCKVDLKHPSHSKCEHSGKNNRDTARNADYIAYATFKDLNSATIEDVRRLRENPLISKHVRIAGFIYNVETRKLELVAVSEAK